ncbi:hypothetical protein [Maribacter sp. 2304DJ31-5]|uniref:hypothetical protein n=1 Tax=Maribacter sp. 2304DJ31-5 TaxID=3386273 RepID=UPI0039BCF040
MACPNTRIRKTGSTNPFVGFSLHSKSAAAMEARQIGDALGHIAADTWFATKSCEAPCETVTNTVVRVRVTTPIKRGWWVLFIVVWIIPIPIFLYGWKAHAVADWEAFFMCRNLGQIVGIQDIDEP